MRKTALLMALVILLVIPTSVQAAEPRLITQSLNLSYNQSVATCTANIIGESTSDYLEATIKLWRGNTCNSIRATLRILRIMGQPFYEYILILQRRL